jgi:hypothetical protein
MSRNQRRLPSSYFIRGKIFFGRRRQAFLKKEEEACIYFGESDFKQDNRESESSLYGFRQNFLAPV